MNSETCPLPVPRRTFLATTGLALLAPVVGGGTKAQAAPTRFLGSVQVTISGTGHAFRFVTANFSLPSGESVPYYAWNSRASSVSFTMPLTTKGLHLSVGGAKPQELMLKTLGSHRLTLDSSELQITVTAA